MRELRNLVMRCSALSRSPVIEVHELDLPQPEHRTTPHILAGTVDDMERRLIFEALAQTQGHHQKAAEILGISRRTLHRKLKSYEQESANASAT